MEAPPTDASGIPRNGVLINRSGAGLIIPAGGIFALLALRERATPHI